MSSQEEYSPTYRQRDVDKALDDHDRRLTRLEKAAFIGAGYALASGSDAVQLLGALI